MAVYFPGHYGRGVHFANWHKTVSNLARLTRLTKELNEAAWLLAYRVEGSKNNVSAQAIPEKLGGFASLLEDVSAQITDLLSKEALPPAEEARKAFEELKPREARDSTYNSGEQARKEIRGKRHRACMRDGKVFLTFQKRADLPISVGFELDFDQRRSEGPVYLDSQAKAENFVRGEGV
jgi:hypothetical protein